MIHARSLNVIRRNFFFRIELRAQSVFGLWTAHPCKKTKTHIQKKQDAWQDLSFRLRAVFLTSFSSCFN